MPSSPGHLCPLGVCVRAGGQGGSLKNHPFNKEKTTTKTKILPGKGEGRLQLEECVLAVPCLHLMLLLHVRPLPPGPPCNTVPARGQNGGGACSSHRAAPHPVPLPQEHPAVSLEDHFYILRQGNRDSTGREAPELAIPVSSGAPVPPMLGRLPGTI